MQAEKILKNDNGDALMVIRQTDQAALYQVVSQVNQRLTENYFVTKTEPKTGSYGREIHLAGEGKWEQAGKYVNGKVKAEAVFQSLHIETAEQKREKEYYTPKI